MGPGIWSVGCRPMIAAFKFEPVVGKLGPLSNPGPVPTPPATPPSLPAGGVNGFGGTLVRSVVSERCAPPGSVHVTVSSGSASTGSGAGGLGAAGGATNGLACFGAGGGAGAGTSATRSGDGKSWFSLICGEACRISCRELRGFGDTTIFTVSDFTSPRGSGASPILTG